MSADEVGKPRTQSWEGNKIIFVGTPRARDGKTGTSQLTALVHF